MSTITIPKEQFDELLEKAFRYEHLRQLMEEDIFAPPPTRSGRAIIRAFVQTKRYTPAFLKSFEKGLKRSSYFRAREK